MTKEPEHFVLGITMAGAVSAGAYTAGVLDFLFRALDAHNARVAEGSNDPDAPRHRVVLKVMSGASAGGVCAALGLAGLIGSQKPSAGRLREATDVETEPSPGCSYTYSYALDTLHDVWVTGLDLWRPTSQQGFLALDDFERGSDLVQSVLNSTHIDEVARNALSDIRWGTSEAPGQPVSFLSDPIDIFLTTTNLMGVPYKVRFAEANGRPDGGHRMAQHGAVRHFRMTDLGESPVRSDWLQAWGDEGILLSLPEPGEALPLEDTSSPWSSFQAASIATGAFPVGLAPRLIEAEAQDFARIKTDKARGGALPIDVDPDEVLYAAPEFGPDTQPETKVRFVAVDGGLINNEPFEYARFTIRRRSNNGATDRNECAKKSGDRFLAPNPREADKADRAVLMIDPFPEGPEYEALELEAVRKQVGLIPSALKLFPSLKNQARFKPAELIHAAKGDVHSRFLVSPTRSADEAHGEKSGANAIASGGLGGFLGFADESFRMHDFILGQRNCQKFLKDHFNLSSQNPVLRLRPDDLERNRSSTRRIVDPGGALDSEIPLPKWPQIGGDRLNEILAQAKLRLGKVGDGVLTETSPSGLLTFVLRTIWNFRWPIKGLGHHLEKNLVKVLTTELILRDQHADYSGLSDDMRRVVAELLAQGEEPVTAKELIQKASENLNNGSGLNLSAKEVESTLDQLAERDLVWREPWTLFRSERRFTHGHKVFRPGRLKSIGLALG